MPVIINKEECEGCGSCMAVCPNSAVILVEVEGGAAVAEIVPELCNDCGECIEFCLRGIIKKA